MSEEIFIQLVTEINRSDLSARDKNQFKTLLFDAPPEALELLIQLFNQDPAFVGRLYKNYLDKRRIMQKDDHDAWKKLMEQEYKQLKKFEA